MPVLEVALNGSRNHPKVPRTPTELGSDAQDCIQAGASVVHVHAFASGHETLEAGPCAATVRAVHAARPGALVSLTTFAEIEPDPVKRLKLVMSWTEMPDLVTANQGEPGIYEVCEFLLDEGVGIEAGLLSTRDAEAFVASGLAHRCVRVLVEPLDPDPRVAVAHAEAMEKILADARISVGRVFHGDGVASWAVNEKGLLLGYGIRTGLEDTPFLPDGSLAPDNVSLVRAAAAMIERSRRK